MCDCRFGVSPVNYPDPDPDLCNGKSLLVWYSIGLGPFGETVNKDIPVALLGFYQRTKDIDGYLLHRFPYLILLQRCTFWNAGGLLGNADVARSTVLHDIFFHALPVETPFQSINHLVTLSDQL